MATELEDLEVLKNVEAIADHIWHEVNNWDAFARDVVGKQLTRAVDSVGANIAESYGRFHYGNKLNFLYYARGSLFETKYWINRSASRNLFKKEQAETFAKQLTHIARQINLFAKSIKKQKYREKSTLREPEPTYHVDSNKHLFTDSDLDWLMAANSNDLPQSLISSLQSPQENNHD
jgi:four helix bundle protein